MQKIKNVVLVNYVADNSKTVDSGLYPHLSIKSLFAFLKEMQTTNKLDAEIKIEEIDGDLVDEEMQQNVIFANISDDTLFGFYTALNNYEYVERISKKIKARNPETFIIIGGPWATYLPEQILHTNPHIDGLVVGDGEIPLFRILKGDEWSDITGLNYRDKSNVLMREKNKYSWVGIHEMPYPLKYQNSLDNYFKKQQTRYGKDYEKSTATYFSRGSCTGKCVFCSIHDKKGRDRCASEIWEEITYYRNTFGVEHIFNVSENISYQWMESFANLAKQYNNDRKITFKMFASADIITPAFLEKFMEAGGTRLFIGFESNAEKVLQLGKCGKTTVAQNENVLDLIMKENLELEGGFVFGLPGEDEISMKQTERFIHKCTEYKNTKLLLASFVVPLPGSLLWRQYIQGNEENARKYIREGNAFKKPVFRITDIQEDYTRACKQVRVPIEQVRELQLRLYTENPHIFECWEMHEPDFVKPLV